MKSLDEIIKNKYESINSLELSAKHGLLYNFIYLINDEGSVSYKIIKNVCRYKQINILKYIVNNVLLIHSDNDILLRMAVKYNSIKLVNYLLNNGAYVDVLDNYCVKYCSKYNYLSLLKKLYCHKNNYNINLLAGIPHASYYGNIEILKYILTNEECNEETLYMSVKYAVMNNQIEIIQYLLFILKTGFLGHNLLKNYVTKCCKYYKRFNILFIINNNYYKKMIISPILIPSKVTELLEYNLESDNDSDYSDTDNEESSYVTSNENDDDNEEDDNEICNICLEKLKFDNNYPRCHECKHIFHFKCLNEWLGNDKDSCPHCRSLII